MFHESLHSTGHLKHPHETVWAAVSDDHKGTRRNRTTARWPPAPPPQAPRVGPAGARWPSGVTPRASASCPNSPRRSASRPRRTGSVWTELPRSVSADAEPAGHVRLDCARASTARQSFDAQLDSLAEVRGDAGLLGEGFDPRHEAARAGGRRAALRGDPLFRRRRDPRCPRAQAGSAAASNSPCAPRD